MKTLAALLCVFATAHGMYSSSDDVIELTPSNFDAKVKNSDGLWLIEFYAPWCGHCKSLTPEWKKAATALKGVVNIAAVDADQHKSLGGQFGVRGFPTIKVFGLNKNKPEDYQGARSASGIIDAALAKVKSMVNDRAAGKGGKSGGGGDKKKPGAGSPKDVIELTDGNFDELVMKSKDMWLVEFYAPWCGHCKSLAPQWQSAATELKGKVRMGALDATVHTLVAGRYQIQGFPTIKYFPAGAKENAEEYDGGRTSSDIINWSLEKVAENVPAPDVEELVSEDGLKGACDDHQLCVISVLPHILDCQSDCRNGYLKTLKTLGEKYKKKMWGWVWAEAGSQPELEESLGIGGFGYPAMAALNSRKMKFALLKGAFSETGINEFLRELSYGRGSTAPIKNAQLPKISKSTPWDGKDGELIVEEDIDLSDVELEPLDKDEL